MGKHKIIYVLSYNEWDSGGGEFSENIVASHSKETIEAYKKNLEIESEKLQDTLGDMEEEKLNKLKPLWEELHPIIQSLRQSNAIKMGEKERSKAVAERKRLTDLTGAIHEEYYKKKNDLLNSLGLEYAIEDSEEASFTIEEVKVI